MMWMSWFMTAVDSGPLPGWQSDGRSVPKMGYGLRMIEGMRIQHRWLWWAAIAAGATYLPASWLLPAGPMITAWKGAGVALLALWAAQQARSLDGWLLVTVLTLGAAGDVLLEVSGLTTGALAFLAGHLVALALYARNLRPLSWKADGPIAFGRLLIIPVLAFVFPADRASAPGIALYAAGLGAMAAMAWLSAFPRSRVSLGALFFAVSDLLIFARLGPLAGSIIPDLLVWPLYFGGQALIAIGVASALGPRAPSITTLRR